MTDAMTQVAVAFEPWPSMDTDSAGAPSAGTITVAVRGATGGVLVVQQWIDPLTLHATRDWPGRADPLTPWLMWEHDARGELAVTAGRNGLVEDAGLATVTLTRGGEQVDARWHGAPGAASAVAGGLIDGLRAALRVSPRRVHDAEMIASSSHDALVRVLAECGADDAALAADHALRSWHTVHAGRMVRVLETDPVLDAAGDRMRARTAAVFDGGAPLSGIGHLVVDSDGPRWWPAGSTPSLDAPHIGDAVPAPLLAVSRALRPA